MSITATEPKKNLKKYLLKAATEDVFVTRNGKVVAKLSNPYQSRMEVAKSLDKRQKYLSEWPIYIHSFTIVWNLLFSLDLE